MKFTSGNLLESGCDALVNTVNTVGVMGKGIALMFKDAFPDNFEDYRIACDQGLLEAGHIHVFDRGSLFEPRWIINFATKKHWRHPSKLEWIESGLYEVRKFIEQNSIRSIAIPPLGAGNGKLDWRIVRPIIERVLADLPNVEILVFEPVERYQNVQKTNGAEKLTPPRAVISEAIRRYSDIGNLCTMLEVQKLAWFIQRISLSISSYNIFQVEFKQDRYGPYAYKLNYLLDSIDGSYINCQKRVADSSPLDFVWFNYKKSEHVELYLKTEAKQFLTVLEKVEDVIGGFESPLNLELLSTVDWLVSHSNVSCDVGSIRSAILDWPGGAGSGQRKYRLFDERLVSIAVERLQSAKLI